MHQIQSRFHLGGYLESRIGGRPENQDACGFSDTPFGALIIVCDGMGGMNGGSTASHLAVKTIIDYISSVSESDDPAEMIKDAVKLANKKILEAGSEDPELQGMGTTLTLVLLNDKCAFATHVGDSRIYQLRSGKKVFRTFDDSMVFQLVKSGAITEEDARVADNSNIITKALGISSELDFEVVCLTYDKGDRFVLCSDGFWGPLPEQDFLSLLDNSKDDLELVLERAFNRVETAAKEWRPTHYDNLTAAVFDVQNNSIIRTKMEKRFKFLSGVLSLLLLLSLGYILFSYRSVNRIERAIKLQEKAINSNAVADSLDNLIKGSVKLKELEKTVSNAKKVAERDSKKAERAVSASRDLVDKVDKLKNIVDANKAPDTNNQSKGNEHE